MVSQGQHTNYHLDVQRATWRDELPIGTKFIMEDDETMTVYKVVDGVECVDCDMSPRCKRLKRPAHPVCGAYTIFKKV